MPTEPNIKFLSVDTGKRLMSHAALIDFLESKRYWPLQLIRSGKRWSVCSVHFSKRGATKAARKILTKFPNRRFLVFGTGWDKSGVALYANPGIPSMVTETRNRRKG